MKGFTPLILGIFATLAFSWLGLAYIPDLQIGRLEPQSDEEGTDIYPMPRSGMAERGRHVYVANGCFYCHSQQVRADYAAADIERKWGDRRSAPRDYIFDRPVLLGKSRLGPDLANIGKRAPVEEEAAAQPSPGGSPGASPAAPGASPPAANASPAAAKPPAPEAAKVPAQSSSPAPAPAASPAQSPPVAPPAASPSDSPALYSAVWHHQHLYSPRSLNLDSDMPAYRFLYEKRRIGGEQSVDALRLRGDEAPEEGWEIVPTYDAECLVAYLMSLNQSHPLPEVKSAARPAASPAASPAAAQPPAKK
jgi:cbb3-type cytochrome oxidase cytochrome c subunit